MPQVLPQVLPQVPQVTQEPQQQVAEVAEVAEVTEVARRAYVPKPPREGPPCTSADRAISHNLSSLWAFHSEKDFLRKLPLQVSISDRYNGKHENR